ncbi:unnamed protein product [Rotaria sordida]|uniref:Uncharacterized protein n=1 Tax=Rotaria sordida TaxID=392033 RepID=A0A816FFA7_9BILA|nr:unnamed protein product [Rotaria sordida]CAF1660810.1 unnamed protein product [Rotaria sordida]
MGKDNDDSGDDDDDDNEPQHYQQLLKSIKWLNTCFNYDTTEPEITGECYFDVVVNRNVGWNEPTITIIQHIKKLKEWDMLIGIIVMDLSNKNCWFALDPNTTESYKGNYKNYNPFFFALNKKYGK